MIPEVVTYGILLTMYFFILWKLKRAKKKCLSIDERRNSIKGIAVYVCAVNLSAQGGTAVGYKERLVGAQTPRRLPAQRVPRPPKYEREICRDYVDDVEFERFISKFSV